MRKLSDDRGRSRAQVPGMWPYGADISEDGPGTPRIRAISVVWAAQAGTFGEVIEFRRRYLSDTLLPADQVDMWLKTRPESTRPPVWWLYDIPLERLVAVADGSYIIPSSIMEEIRHHTPNDLDGPYMNTRLLFYATPEYEHASEPIRATGGILDTLRTTARRVAEFHKPVAPAGMEVKSLWSEWQAVTFVLTGYAPLVPEEFFRLPSRPGRRQTVKAMELAAFVALREAKGMPAAEQFSEWNSRFPAWAYKDLPHFAYDGREAHRRLFDVEAPAPQVSPEPEREYSDQEWNTALLEADRQQGTTESEGAVVLSAGDVSQLLEDTKRRDEAERAKQEPESESEYTAEEAATAHAEKQRQMGGRKSAVWGSEVSQLVEDAKRRTEADQAKKTKKDVG